jgi:hypothetical protein
MLSLRQDRGLIRWRVLDNVRPSVAVAGRHEAARHVAAQQRDIRRVRAVGDRKRSAGSVTGKARLLHLQWIDVSEIYAVLAAHTSDGACEGSRVVELECAGVGGKGHRSRIAGFATMPWPAA